MPPEPNAIHALKCDLAVEALSSSGRLQLEVTGTSMLPSIWPHDLVLIRAARPSELRPGDVVLFRRDAGFCVHRIVANAGDALITRGDALMGDDPPVLPDQVLGRVVTVRRGPLSFAPAPSLTSLQKLLRVLFIRSGRLRAVALRLHAVLLRLPGLAT